MNLIIVMEKTPRTCMGMDFTGTRETKIISHTFFLCIFFNLQFRKTTVIFFLIAIPVGDSLYFVGVSHGYSLLN